MRICRLKLITLTLLFISIIACEKDNDINQNQNFVSNTNLEIFSENFGSDIQRDFLGIITDTNNNPIEGVAINIGSSEATTDSNGVFIIRNASIKSRFAYIIATK